MEKTSNFKKTVAQVKAIDLLASSTKHCMLLGGSRSGKSFIAVYAMVVRAAKHHSRHAILRHTFNSVKTSIWMDTLPKVLQICFPELPVKWNKSDYYITLPNGSEIWIGGLEDDRRVEKILGKEYSTIYFNECTQLSYRSVQIALTRLAERNDLSKKAYYDMNPGTKNSWSYEVFIKSLNPLDSEPLKKPDDYGWTRLNPQDNLDNIDENYLSMLESLSEKERKRFLLGEFQDHSDGQVYYAFDRDKNVRDVPTSGGTMFFGMDFNVDPMSCVIANIVNGKIYVHDEVFLRNADTFRMVDELKKRKYRGTVIPDSTGKNRKTSGKSDFAILEEAGFQIPPVRNPYVMDRVNNVNRLLSSDKLIISPKCGKLINDLEKVMWKDNKLDQKTDKLLTHISDALGYLCWHVDSIDRVGKQKITLR